MNTFPTEEEYGDFIGEVYKAGSKIVGAKKQYKNLMLNFRTPEEFLSDINNKKNIEINLGSYRSSFNDIVIFLSLKCNIKPNFNIQSIVVNNASQIIEYFNLVPSNFEDAMEEKVIGTERRKQTFRIQIIKSLIYLRKRNIKEISYDDLLKLRSDDFLTGRAKTEGIPTLLQSLLAVVNKESLPRRLPKTTDNTKDYGTHLNEIKVIIRKYLDIKYIHKGYQEDSPLSAIRTFFRWLHKEYENIDYLNDISSQYWNKYKEYVTNESSFKERTKQVKIDLVSMFFEWLQIKGEINKNVVLQKERYKGKIKCKPRMFKEREDYIKILKGILDFQPITNREGLVKQFLLVATATGLRAKEILWLGPGCLIDEDDVSAEVVLQIKEKLGIKNKSTSVLKWGINPLKELNKRFENMPNKIKFYNSGTKEHFYSLFQDYDDRILSISFVYKTFEKIMREANINDENGNPLMFPQAKIHAFRHQKFNDIYCVSNGSLTAVKVDSGHQTIKMTKTYIQQNEKARQLEALQLISQSKVVGKGAEIIKALIQTPYSAQRYLEIVKKMNVNLLKEEFLNSKLRKHLGFGFCAGECCINGACERCDFFYTCKTYLAELKDRYSKNFALLMSSLIEDSNNTITNSINKELAIDLKYQEKWLIELGVTNADINELRQCILKEEGPNGYS